MTDDERTLARALSRCTFVPATATKRFARDMGDRAAMDESPELTPKQKKYLYEAVIRFRRQIPGDTVALAFRLNAMRIAAAQQDTE